MVYTKSGNEPSAHKAEPTTIRHEVQTMFRSAVWFTGKKLFFMVWKMLFSSVFKTHINVKKDPNSNNAPVNFLFGLAVCGLIFRGNQFIGDDMGPTRYEQYHQCFINVEFAYNAAQYFAVRRRTIIDEEKELPLPLIGA